MVKVVHGNVATSWQHTWPTWVASLLEILTSSFGNVCLSACVFEFNRPFCQLNHQFCQLNHQFCQLNHQVQCFFPTSHLHHLSVAPRVSRIHRKSPKLFGGWIAIWFELWFSNFMGFEGGYIFLIGWNEQNRWHGEYTFWQSNIACWNLSHFVRWFYWKNTWHFTGGEAPQWCLLVYKL